MSALPPKLSQWQEALKSAPTPETARQIINEYFSFFGQDKPREELWLLTVAALTNDEIQQAQTARDRHDLIFFYEFTKMVLEAAFFIREKEPGI